MKELFNRLTMFLRKKHFFWLVLFGYWNYLVSAENLFAYYEANIYLSLIPQVFVVGICILWIISGLCSISIFLKNKNSKPAYLYTLIWNFILPLIIAIVVFIAADNYYKFGGIFPGLDGLGLAVNSIIFAVLSIIGMVIFIIVNKREQKRLAENREPKKSAERLGDVFNYLALVALIINLIWLGLVYLSDPVQEFKDNVFDKQTEDFEREIINEFSGDRIDDLSSESLQALILIQLVTDDNLKVEGLDEYKDDNEIVRAGIPKYNELQNKYEIQRQIDGINCGVIYDYKNRNVIFTYELEAIDWRQECYKDIVCKVIYDENLNFVDVEYVEE